MKLIYSIFAMLIIVAACVGAIFLVGEPDASTGTAHASIDALQVGGDGLARFQPVANIALLTFSAMLIMFGILLYLGISEHRRTRQCKAWISTGTIALLIVWWSMIGTYSAYLASGEFPMILGFPLPTAFTVYGLWLAGFVFVIAYVVGFRSFVFTKDDEEAYHELVEKFKDHGSTD